MSSPFSEPPVVEDSSVIVLSTRARVRAFFDRLLGHPLPSQEQEENKIGVLRGVPALGLDGLGSSAYGPEAALIILLPLGTLGLAYIGPIIGLICELLVILYFSYRQNIAAYPNGGGSYSVAKANLGTQASLVAAAALIVDYILNVAVGISAGIGALVSAFPALHPYTLGLCLVTLVFITIMNLRGVRESSFVFGIPTYLFIGSSLLVIGLGVAKALLAGGHPLPVVQPPKLSHATLGVSFWLLMRAFASGCTAMTGVEAVSNGVTAFSQPVTQNARRTLTVIVVVLFLLLVGIAYLTHSYEIGARVQNAPGYQSVFSQLVAAIIGRGIIYYLTIGSLLAVLALSANTSFADFPRLCRVVAEDDFLPHSFATLGRRLVYSLGISLLAVLAGLLLIAFGGITDRLIPLFAVGAFLAFTLSQAGMVMHWKKEKDEPSPMALGINALGATVTALALIVILVAKFIEGAWLTVLVIPGLVLVFNRIHAHYHRVESETRCYTPLDPAPLDEPIVVIPIGGWDSVAEKAVKFALRLSSQVEIIYVSSDEKGADELRQQWAELVEGPLQQASLPTPRLVILSSPYRLLFDPLLNHVKTLQQQHPQTYINVFVPELVQSRWVEYLQHTQRALGLKALLLFLRDPYLVVTNVPWYLTAKSKPPS